MIYKINLLNYSHDEIWIGQNWVSIGKFFKSIGHFAATDTLIEYKTVPSE